MKNAKVGKLELFLVKTNRVHILETASGYIGYKLGAAGYSYIFYSISTENPPQYHKMNQILHQLVTM
jgi:hypothetical protein